MAEINPYAPPASSERNLALRSPAPNLASPAVVLRAAVILSLVAQWVAFGIDATGGFTEARSGAYYVQVGGRLLALVAFLVWLHRGISNVRRLERLGIRFSPGLSVLSFFIPLANALLPFRVVTDLVVASAKSPQAARRGTVVLWWGPWLLCVVLGGFAGPAPQENGLGLGLELAAVLSASVAAVGVFMILNDVGLGQGRWERRREKHAARTAAKAAQHAARPPASMTHSAS